MSSTTGITFSGLASGLDTKAIIQALMALEQRPISALQNKKTGYQQQLTLFNTLETKLQALQDAADDVRLSSNFLDYQAGLDTTAFLTASASSSAKSGTYKIDVVSLAQAQVSQSGIYNSGSTPILSGTGNDVLQFTIGSAAPVSITMTGETYSLQDIADAINNDPNLGVTASVLQTTPGQYRLVLTGQVGDANGFTISTPSGSGDLQALVGALNGPPVLDAADAEFTLNGVTVKRTSNQISDAIPGVTLNLVAVGGDTTLTISPDATATGAKVKKLVDTYNDLIDWFDQQSALDSSGQASSPLFGDSTLRTIRGSLRSILGDTTNTGNVAYSMLAQIGIDSDRNGKLTFDQGEFDAAVADDPIAVQKLFADANGGLAARTYTQLDDILDSVDGVLIARKNGYNQRIRDADDQIADLQRRLIQTQAALEKKFATLETVLGRLQSQGSALGSLGSLSASLGRGGSS